MWPVSQEVAMAIAYSIRNDPEIVALNAKLAETERKIANAERRIPIDVRDIETIERHVEGRTSGEIMAYVTDLIGRCSAVAEFVALALLKRAIEERIAVRRDALIPTPSAD